MVQPQYPFEDLPAAGLSREVAPGVRWARMPLPFALDHINLWLLADGDGWTAVDTGLASEPIRAAWSRLLADHPLCRIIVTHFHPDHLGNAAWLQAQTGAPLAMSLGEYTTAQLIHAQIGSCAIAAMLALFRRHGLDGEMLTALETRGNVFKRGVPEIPATYRRLRDGQRVDIGGREWRVIAGFGHAPEHVSLYCAELAVLIAGDMLLPRISTNVPVMAATAFDDPLADFLDSLGRFTELPEDTLVLPSHGLPFRGIRGRVEALRAHHEERCAEVVAACETPKTAAELIPVIFSRPITDPHQCMFAMGEAMAHLNYVERRRQVRRVDDGGVSRFVRSN